MVCGVGLQCGSVTTETFAYWWDRSVTTETFILVGGGGGVDMIGLTRPPATTDGHIHGATYKNPFHSPTPSITHAGPARKSVGYPLEIAVNRT